MQLPRYALLFVEPSASACQGRARWRGGLGILPGVGDLTERRAAVRSGKPNARGRPWPLRLKWESESLLKRGSYSAYLKWESEKKVTSLVPTPGAIIYMRLRSRGRSHVISAHSRTSPGVSAGDPEGGRCVGGMCAGISAATGQRCEVVVVQGGRARCAEHAGAPAVHRKEKGRP